MYNVLLLHLTKWNFWVKNFPLKQFLLLQSNSYLDWTTCFEWDKSDYLLALNRFWNSVSQEFGGCITRNLSIHNAVHWLNIKIIIALSVVEQYNVKIIFGGWGRSTWFCVLVLYSQSIAWLPEWCDIKVIPSLDSCSKHIFCFCIKGIS
jgi:hypothetical protein